MKGKKVKRKPKKGMSTFDIMKGIRKPMPKPSRVHPSKIYDRRDKSWRDTDE